MAQFEQLKRAFGRPDAPTVMVIECRKSFDDLTGRKLGLNTFDSRHPRHR